VHARVPRPRPELLVRLTTESGVRLITNTGLYGAAGNKYLPAFARDETADQLAARWLAEWKDGIEGTGVRPGFIKIGVDAGPLSDLHRKLVRAAARTQQGSGLTIACHTGDGRAALDELAVLKEEGVSPSAWVWVHANAERDPAIHLEVARAGGWVEFDGVGPQDGGRHVQLVLNLDRHGLLNRVLISQDAGWYNVGTPAGGNVRPYDYLLTKFLSALKEAGLTDRHVRQLTADNPREAFTVRKRRP
jgi:phosphotriesterase-related protein